MMVMTAKINFKKILMLLGAVFAVVLAAVLLMDGGKEDSAAPSMAGNEARVQFLQDMGWTVQETPKEASQVKIPREANPVYERYNNLQKSQGYDLTDHAGKKVMRYVYTVTDIQGNESPVYATLLVLGDKIIGGDVTDTSTGGKIRGFRNTETPKAVPAPTEVTEAPAEFPEETQTEGHPQ